MNLRRWLPLCLVLLAALVLRLALWGRLPREGLISDEGEYLAAAVWLAQGRGFTWYQGWLWTRAPLYPFFLAVHIRLFGLNLTPIYLSQTVLSLLQVVLVYALAALAVPRLPGRAARVTPMLASLLMALYFPLAVYTQVLLSETLYITLLLAALLALGWWAARVSSMQHWRDHWPLIAGGVLLGLATLTRGLALGFVPLAAAWVGVVFWRQKAEGSVGAEGGRQKAEGRRQKATIKSALSCALLFILCSLAPVLPWSVYATRLYGGLIAVDTTSAYNLLLGARTAYDGNRKDAATRTFVLALLDARISAKDRNTYLSASCLGRHDDTSLRYARNQSVADISQAQRQQLMTAEGLCLLKERPLAFAQKSLGEFIDFFRINYGGDERFTDGFTTGRLPPAYTLGLFLFDDTLYVLTLPLAVVGWVVGRAGDRGLRTEDREQQRIDSRTSGATNGRAFALWFPVDLRSPVSGLPSAFSLLVALWWLYNLLAAPLLFAINRFRVPLMPLVLIYAAYAVVALSTGGWRLLGKRHVPHLALAATLLFVVVAPASWISAYDPVAQAYRAQESYLGGHPASVADTMLALQARSQYERTQTLQDALRASDTARAGELLAAGGIATPTLMLARPLLAGLEGRPADGLALLPEHTTLVSDTLWQTQKPMSDWGSLWRAQASIVQGDLLRRTGDLAGARAAFTPTFVDNANPVEWAWNWLHPPPLPNNRIDLGGNLDLGYIQGFYLGEGDFKVGEDGVKAKTTWRWSSGTAQLRFPKAGTGAPQTLRLLVYAASIALPHPSFTVLVGNQFVATIPLSADVQTYNVALPVTPQGGDVVVTLQTPVFVPPASDYLAQQGMQAGQLRLLGLPIDWVELR